MDLYVCKKKMLRVLVGILFGKSTQENLMNRFVRLRVVRGGIFSGEVFCLGRIVRSGDPVWARRSADLADVELWFARSRGLAWAHWRSRLGAVECGCLEQVATRRV